MRSLAAAALVAGSLLAAPACAVVFVPGNLVVSVEGNGVWGAPAGTSTFSDNQAAPLTLMEFTTSGAYVGAETLPTTTSGYNNAISGEYGSSSEGLLQLSGNGAYLTVMGYGVNYQAFNADPTAYGTLTTDPTKSTALGQSGSLTGQGYTAVPRVIALIDSDGAVSTQTEVYNVFNGNNPRSVYTTNGKTFYISGQGASPDQTGGVFYISHTGVTTTPTPITGDDTQSGSSTPYDSTQDTRFVTEYDGKLYVSVDSKEGKNNARSFVGSLGASPTSVYTDPTDTTYNGTGPTMLPGYGNTGGTGKVTITAAQSNGLNSGDSINLSPEQFYFASPTVLYVTDSGDSKQTSASTTIGDGGLQKWVFSSGSWHLEYTLGLNAGLPEVAGSSASGTSGLFGLAAEVDPSNPADILLVVTTYSLTDTGPTYLYEIVDQLSATTRNTTVGSGLDTFTLLDTAPADSNFKGVSFAPYVLGGAVPEPATWALMLGGLGLVGAAARRARRLEAQPSLA